jgi:uncharacterized protein (UPF0128 family)
MNEDKVIELMDQELKTHGAVWIELRCGTQFNVTGTQYEIFDSKLEIYNDDDLMAIIYMNDIALIGAVA